MIRRMGTRFHVYGMVGPKRERRKTFLGSCESRREAESVERRHLVTEEQIAAGELAPNLDLKRTVRSAVSDWLESLKGKSRSWDIYDHRMKRYILPVIGDVVLARVNSSHLMRWRDGLSKQVAAATVNTTIGTLSSAFEFCVSMQWLEKNPCHGLKRLEQPETKFEWIQTREQITRLLAACSASIQPIIAIIVGTGMRLDEVLHLEWSDIDLEHRLIHVHRGRKGTVKSGKVRRVPVFDNILSVLRDLRLRRGDNVLVFPGELVPETKKRKARSKPGVFKPYKVAVVKAGLPRQLRIHDLRHTFASHFLLDGGDIFRLSKILGHSTVAVTERVYAHMKPDAFEEDYGRVAFAMPTTGRVLELARVAP